ncbi:MAG TPA: NAD(P)H-hydrate dehydratase [Gemmatimonadaceae bacterium]|nr:NAD(P)H-hydrate dehydratase [Gemmatimonadaceae bacterium]
MTVLVTSAAEAAALDAATISAGTPSRDLMRRAGTAAAAEMIRLLGERARAGVRVLAGGGNNGGDGWVVAAQLARRGIPVQIIEIAPARTDDARAERNAALAVLEKAIPPGDGAIIVDALIGTGSSGKPRGAVGAAVQAIRKARAAGAHVVSLDLPSGLDATTGAAEGAVTADVTLTFGSIKRGHLTSRGSCGRIVALDIGLLPPAADGQLPELLGANDVYPLVPQIPARAHKGTRKKVAIVGGSEGMAGAVLLAAHAAFRSGVGLLRLCVAQGSVSAVHGAAPAALVTEWQPDAEYDDCNSSWADALVIGPGLGKSVRAMRLAEHVFRGKAKLLVVDADALNMFSRDSQQLVELLDGRPAILTPHPAELGRLMQRQTSEVDASRFEIALEAARAFGSVVLLKGTPTIIAAPDGEVRVSATGTPALATGGSGDLLAGMIGTLLAQTGDPFVSACAAAWIHGRAAELATGDRNSRGTTLDDVLRMLPEAWQPVEEKLAPGVLAELPAIR